MYEGLGAGTRRRGGLEPAALKISGFTIVRQGRHFAYPFEESIRSLLPLVDEMVVGVGDGRDGTWDAVKKIGSPKIKAFRSVWEMGERQGGRVLSVETNKALSRCQGDWGIYLQADELLHEDDLELIRESLRREKESLVEGLSFRYLHFYGSYQTIQDQRRKWYRRAIRAVRLGRGVESVGDAYGFRIRGRSLIRKDSGARIFHYGWTRPPETMLQKQMNLDRMYHDESWVQVQHAKALAAQEAFYRDRGNLRFFRGSHPAVMAARVQSQDWSFEHGIGRQAPDWLRHLDTLLFYPLRRHWAKR
jgi:hypothetical protein